MTENKAGAVMETLGAVDSMFGHTALSVLPSLGRPRDMHEDVSITAVYHHFK